MSKLKLKNTFIHMEPDYDDFDDSEWLIRRQVSAPAPPRQLSNKKPLNKKLGSFAENDLSEVDSPKSSNLDVDFEIIGAGFAPSRQTSIDLETVGQELKRQISETSQAGLDRQMTSMSVSSDQPRSAGISRQVTEQMWPSYIICEGEQPVKIEVPEIENDTNTIDASIFLHEDQSKPASSTHDYGQGKEQLKSALGGNEDCSMMPMPPFMMQQLMMQNCWEAAVNKANVMTHAGTINRDVGAGINESPDTTKKNRRKARSLITIAQEEQRKREQDAARQFTLQQHQMLQQQLMISMNVATMGSVQPVVAPTKPKKAAETEASKKEQVPEGVKTQVKSEKTMEPSKDAEKKFCPHCGGPVFRQHKFCQYCGSNLQAIWNL